MRKSLTLVVLCAAAFCLAPGSEEGTLCDGPGDAELKVYFVNRGQDYIFLRGAGNIEVGEEKTIAYLKPKEEKTFVLRRNGVNWVDMGVLKIEASHQDGQYARANVTMTEPEPNNLVFTSNMSILTVEYHRP